jgi:hypothetical protein
MAEALTDALESVEPPAPEVKAVTEDAEEFLSNLVGEGKKYSSANDLAKAYHHINIHVDELKSDLDQYKGGKELLNEVLDEIRNSNPEESTPISATPQAPVETRPQTEDVAKLVSDEFSRKEREAVEKRNVQNSLEQLTKIYGGESQAKAAVAKTIGSDNHIKGVIDNLSLTSPDAMVKFITGITPAGTAVEGNTPGVNASTGAPIAPTGLTWEQCRQIRKDDPRKYASIEFRQSMEAAANVAASKGIDYFAT